MKSRVLDESLSMFNQSSIWRIVLLYYSFNIQYILKSKYNSIGKETIGKYLVQTRSQAKSHGISLPEVHGIGKGLDQNILPERQVNKPLITSEVKGISQIKQRIDQGGAGLRWNIKTPIAPSINKPIEKLTKNQFNILKIWHNQK